MQALTEGWALGRSRKGYPWQQPEERGSNGGAGQWADGVRKSLEAFFWFNFLTNVGNKSTAKSKDGRRDA